MLYIPNVQEDTQHGPRSYDLYSRLLNDRIIFLTGEINSYLANSIIGQLLFLENDNSNKDISLYINSPGGCINDGLAILDTINFIKCDVTTICVGQAASMAAILLAAGTKGKRYALPNSEIMIHQPLGGMRGQASDIEIHAKNILKAKTKVNKILSNLTGQTLSTIEKDTDRDNYLSATEAKKYGLIDGVLLHRKDKNKEA